jgi:hypothetical protein
MGMEESEAEEKTEREKFKFLGKRIFLPMRISRL